MFIGGGLEIGGPGDPGRFGSTRGRIGNSFAQGVNYPSPFFDIAHTYFPTSIKQLFRWCRYYFLTNGIVNAVVFKLAEYPVTDLLFDHPNKQVVNRWQEYFHDQLNYKEFMIEAGLDYFTYGLSLPGIVFPFKKFLRCRTCKMREEARKIRPFWTFTNYEFRLTCPRCGNTDSADAEDIYFRNANGIRMRRWSPEDIDIRTDENTNATTYFYNVPPVLRNDCIIGKKDVVETTSQVLIQAMKQQKSVVLTEDLVFRLKRPSLAGHDRGYGTPLMLGSLKDLFYLQIMKKAQEAVLLERIVPLTVLFPQAGGGTSDPYTTINLVDWRDHVATEIARWRRDPNYYPILPLPIGSQVLGGDGKALLLTQEIQITIEQIINQMQCPLEFVKGGLTFSGSSVSMRMMENHFLGYMGRHLLMANWVMRSVANFMEWPVASVRFKPFKMADDIQRKAYLFQLNQANKISDTTLLADIDLDQEDENKIMLRETASRIEATKKQQIAMAEMQAEAQAILMKQQVKSQQEAQSAMAAGSAPGEPGGPDDPAGMAAPGGQGSAPLPAELQDPMASPLNAGQRQQGAGGAQPQGGATPVGGGGVDLIAIATSMASQLASMDQQGQSQALQQIRKQSPELADLVLQFLMQLGGVGQQGAAGMGGANGAAASQVNMQPLPEARSPRRSAAII